jgi:hypothetical protein
MEAAAGKPVALSFDWARLDTRAYNPLPTLQARLHQAFANPAGLMGCLASTVEQVCSTPDGQASLRRYRGVGGGHGRALGRRWSCPSTRSGWR